MTTTGWIITFGAIALAVAAINFALLAGRHFADTARDDIVVPTVALPGYEPDRAHPTDAGADLRITRRVVLNPGARELVGTGVRVAFPTGTWGAVVPRSSLPHKMGVTVANSPGTIDADYRGEIKINLINHGDKRVVLEEGERVAQLITLPALNAQFLQVGDLGTTVRGEGGHGSTGRA